MMLVDAAALVWSGWGLGTVLKRKKVLLAMRIILVKIGISPRSNVTNKIISWRIGPSICSATV
jgi:hypothetical protein